MMIEERGRKGNPRQPGRLFCQATRAFRCVLILRKKKNNASNHVFIVYGTFGTPESLLAVFSMIYDICRGWFRGNAINSGLYGRRHTAAAVT
ncbi:hypothetical protein EVAR_61618_1 [Eumeta japonica]|uniref:Uncharacterized protein n=1 Tax=Eumeta variegata TaxID=151549 RepID=A0A4C1ZMW0_EUMVA|nr:hypothetical protein EVAR_61618_1 [Eumeta japonica]